jgi:hypothetical protein
VLERIGPNAYQLNRLQHVGDIHAMFHLWMHELYVSDGQTAPQSPPPIERDNEEEYELDRILQSGHCYHAFRYRV